MIKWRLLRKFKLELPRKPASPPMSIYPKELKARTQADRCTPMFIAVLITIAKMWEPPKPINRWIFKMWNIYVKRNIIHF